MTVIKTKQNKMRKEYKFREGSRLPQKKAPSVGRHLEKLWKLNDEYLDAKIVLRDAKNKNSPLHDDAFFDWNDDVAAHKHRMTQAGDILRAVHVQIYEVDDEGNEDEIFVGRAFMPIEYEEDNTEDYVEVYAKSFTPIIPAMSDPESRRQIIDLALDEARSWQKRYRNLKELSEIFSAIDNTLEGF